MIDSIKQHDTTSIHNLDDLNAQLARDERDEAAEELIGAAEDVFLAACDPEHDTLSTAGLRAVLAFAYEKWKQS